MGANYPLADGSEQQWSEWAVLVLNATAAIAGTLLFTRPELRQEITTFLDTIKSAKTLDLANKDLEKSLNRNNFV